jgi:hypothetical protein
MKAVGQEDSTNIAWSVVDGEAMLLDTSSGDYFSLNPIATEIWQYLYRGHDLAHIVATIAGKYGVRCDVVRADVDELIGQLRAAKLWT